jgi:hypothetical protein
MEAELDVNGELRVSRVLNSILDAFLVAFRVARHAACCQVVSFSEESHPGSVNGNIILDDCPARF